MLEKAVIVQQNDPPVASLPSLRCLSHTIRKFVLQVKNTANEAADWCMLPDVLVSEACSSPHETTDYRNWGMGVCAEMGACSGQYSTRCVAARTHVFYLLIFVPMLIVSLGCVCKV